MAKSVPMANADDLIPSREVAKILDVGRSTLTRWVQEGRLKEAKKFDGVTGPRLFWRDDVLRLAAELDRSPTSDTAGAA